VPHLKPARSGLPPVAISNAVRRIGGFAPGLPTRSGCRIGARLRSAAWPQMT